MNAVTRAELAQIEAPTVKFSLNGKQVEGRANETVLQVADREGVEIPRLCYKPGLDTAGNCRCCMVEIKGERTLAPSCCRTPTAGMEVTTDSPLRRRWCWSCCRPTCRKRSTPATTSWTNGPRS